MRKQKRKALERALRIMDEEILTDKSRWIKRNSAVDKDGLSCEAFSPEAVRWCLGGAFIKAVHPDDPDDKKYFWFCELFMRTQLASFNRVTGFNDHPNTMFKDVKEAIHQMQSLLKESSDDEQFKI